jgi:DNA-binding NarL/FixJ family response regulator
VTIRVLLVDDQPLLRTGFRLILEGEPDIAVVGEAGDGARAVELTRTLLPEVVLMDIRMPGVDGIEATRRIVREEAATHDPRVLILTTFDLDEYVVEAVRAGASGFLLKDATPEELLAAIRVVAAGEALLAPAATRHLVDAFVSRPSLGRPDARLVGALTGREREVLRLVAQGLSNAEIAGRLVVSPATAKTHVSRILTKLGLRDRAQLVIAAYESGLITPGG